VLEFVHFWSDFVANSKGLDANYDYTIDFIMPVNLFRFVVSFFFMEDLMISFPT